MKHRFTLPLVLIILIGMGVVMSIRSMLFPTCDCSYTESLRVQDNPVYVVEFTTRAIRDDPQILGVCLSGEHKNLEEPLECMTDVYTFSERSSRLPEAPSGATHAYVVYCNQAGEWSVFSRLVGDTQHLYAVLPLRHPDFVPVHTLFYEGYFMLTVTRNL